MKMNNALKLLLIAGFGSVMVACASTTKVAECNWPDKPDKEAPGWICGEPVEGLAVSAVGFSEKSAAGIAFTRNKAAADARTQLANQIGVKVEALFKEYIGTTGKAGAVTETVDAAAEDIKELFSSQNLADTRVYKNITSPSGNTFILVGFDTAALATQVSKTIQEASANSSFNNDNAAWQQFKASQGHEYLRKRVEGQ